MQFAGFNYVRLNKSKFLTYQNKSDIKLEIMQYNYIIHMLLS
jgi:hypothetical protein